MDTAEFQVQAVMPTARVKPAAAKLRMPLEPERGSSVLVTALSSFVFCRWACLCRVRSSCVRLFCV